ncbi:MAG TPA: hypothetical protein VGI14_09165 [Casimicrobiaceae bacterium]|jgi:hypothetical protein
MRSQIASLVACAAFAATTVAADAAPVRLAPQVQLSTGELVRLQAAADQGPEALRRFLWRTRMIYNWDWSDLVAE